MSVQRHDGNLQFTQNALDMAALPTLIVSRPLTPTGLVYVGIGQMILPCRRRIHWMQFVARACISKPKESTSLFMS